MAIAGLGALGLIASVDGPASAFGRQVPTAEPTLESRNRRSKMGKLVLRLGGSGLKRSPGHGSHRSHSSHSSHSSHASHYSGSGGSPSPAPRPRAAPRSDAPPLYVPRSDSPAPPVTPRPFSREGALVGIDTPATLETIDRKTRKVTAKLASGLSQEFVYAPTVEILAYTPNEVKIRLDQLLALAPDAFPLHVGQKVVIRWTYQDHHRVALHFKIDPPSQP